MRLGSTCWVDCVWLTGKSSIAEESWVQVSARQLPTVAEKSPNTTTYPTTLTDGVIGNTLDFGSGYSRFES
jgi:hypothetical protein